MLRSHLGTAVLQRHSPNHDLRQLRSSGVLARSCALERFQAGGECSEGGRDWRRHGAKASYRPRLLLRLRAGYSPCLYESFPCESRLEPLCLESAHARFQGGVRGAQAQDFLRQGLRRRHEHGREAAVGHSSV